MSKKYYISIQIGTEKYNIFVLGYDKTNGYFITDLSSAKGRYWITKIRFQLTGARTMIVPIDKKDEWYVTRKPKLMQHIDGKAQISGDGIRSGFFKSIKRPKGVSTESPTFNDGGPVFSFLGWGLENFSKKHEKESIIFQQKDLHLDPFLDQNTLKGDYYLFEGYYIPREAAKYIDQKTGILLYKTVALGTIPLKCIPLPSSNTPGFVGISCRRVNHGFNKTHGFSYGGGVSQGDKDGFLTQINVMYPLDEDFHKNSTSYPKELDFSFKDRVLSKIDDVISKIFKHDSSKK
ncbi:MAG: hypothetical protein JWP09_440 [Candidatus Taylorbacteria bacterium]|nr:hypothetical protein [Candidatus Taylorbacteria bacterium]